LASKIVEFNDARRLMIFFLFLSSFSIYKTPPAKTIFTLLMAASTNSPSQGCFRAARRRTHPLLGTLI
jgi:hypothetical protein